MANELTAQQKLAVENRGGKLLVSAAAGSGKTKVLVDRLMLYLTDPVDPANLDDFLIITYTKAAAAELRGKIAAKLTERIAQEPENRHLLGQMQRLFLAKISTVHGFCGDVLREYAYRLDLAPDFRIGDENECRELRETVVQDLLDRAYDQANDSDFQAFINTQGVGRDDRQIPALIQRVYDSAKCHQDPEAWLDNCLRMAGAAHTDDAGKTKWGQYLMEDLFSYLDCQIAVFSQCVQWASDYSELEKTTPTLTDALNKLQQLRQAKTWDEIVHLGYPKFDTLRFPRKNNPDLDTTERVKAAWKSCKAGLKKKFRAFDNDSAQILEDLAQSLSATKGLVCLVRQFDRDYSAAKRSRRILDFSDLEHKTLDLLWGKSRSNPTAAATEIGRRYREVLVDEYQDSNGVQDAIFDALTRQRQNCFMVGDVKQSIYQFRLADPQIFLKKYNEYRPAETAGPGEGRKIFLSHNFRSGGEVISAVNHVFRSCMRPHVGGLLYGDDEALKEGVPHEPLPEAGVELHVMASQGNAYATEAAFVAQRIADMLQKGTLVRGSDGLRPVQPEDIVLLMRAPGSCGGAFVQALEAKGIRCAFGSGGDLLQTEEIAVFRALLQTIQNPRQDIPLLSVLASPLFCFTADDLATIRAGQQWGPIYEALQTSTMPKAQSFLAVLDTLRREARMNGLSALLETCLRLTRLDSIYAAMDSGENKAANIRSFFQLAVSFENGSVKDLGQFLDHLSALEGKGLLSSATSTAGCVTIMSIHKSKGLEFPVVFLCCLAHKFNPESQRATILCDKQLGLGLSVADTQNRVRYPSIAKRAIATKMAMEGISEEMRVLYVAMTRAKDRLIMTYCDTKPESLLAELAQRMDFDDGELICREAVCPGEWVLMAALQRTEAGALHALGDRPKHTTIDDFPWVINAAEPLPIQEEVHTETHCRPAPPEEATAQLAAALRSQYPHLPTTLAPSKQTATGRKGRVKDTEAAENTREEPPLLRTWRRPTFLDPETQGKTVGSAIHEALQYIRYEACGSETDITQELDRLCAEGFMTQQQRALVRPQKLFKLFSSELGQKMRMGNCLREFKFSILDDGRHYGDDLAGEQVLLQGVVDCAILEEDGITIIDFKTDSATEQTLPQLLDRYRLQVETYGEALTRIYEKPVKQRFLYVFSLDRFVEI